MNGSKMKPRIKRVAEWKAVAGYEGCYEVNDHGKVRSIDRTRAYSRNGISFIRSYAGREMSPHRNKVTRSYTRLTVILCKDGSQKRKVIARLVAEAFIPNPHRKPCVNHIDHDPTNNRVSNLEWCTHKENTQHAIKAGRFSSHRAGIFNEKHPSSKAVIATNAEGGSFHFPSMAEANRQVGASISKISQVCNGQRNFHHGMKWRFDMSAAVIRRIASELKVVDYDEFRKKTASDVLAVHRVGKSSLMKLRLFLAHRNLSLKRDNPPAYWLDVERVNNNSDEEVVGVCPFTIIIDSNECFNFTFDSIEDSKGTPVSVPVERFPLYQHGMADYSIAGMLEDVQIERKADDIYSSIANHDDFESKIARWNDMTEFASVVIEKPWQEVLSDSHEHGARAKSVSRSVISWMVRYPNVHWQFCAGRDHAEQMTFRLLEKFWWSKNHRRTEALKSANECGLFKEL